MGPGGSGIVPRGRGRRRPGGSHALDGVGAGSGLAGARAPGGAGGGAGPGPCAGARGGHGLRRSGARAGLHAVRGGPRALPPRALGGGRREHGRDRRSRAQGGPGLRRAGAALGGQGVPAGQGTLAARGLDRADQGLPGLARDGPCPGDPDQARRRRRGGRPTGRQAHAGEGPGARPQGPRRTPRGHGEAAVPRSARAGRGRPTRAAAPRLGGHGGRVRGADGGMGTDPFQGSRPRTRSWWCTWSPAAPPTSAA